MIFPILQQACLISTGITMKEGNDGWQNLYADTENINGVANRFVYYDVPEIFDIPDLTFMKESYPVQIIFGGKSELDWTPAQHRVVMDACKNDLREFVAFCRDNPTLIERISDVRALGFWAMFDACSSGYVLSARIVPRLNLPSC